MRIEATAPVFSAKHKVVYENIQKELKPISKELDNLAENNHVDLLIVKSKDIDVLKNADAYMIKASRNKEHGIQTFTVLKNSDEKWLFDGILEKTRLAIKTVLGKSELTGAEKFATMVKSFLL